MPPWESIPVTGPLLRPKWAAAYLGITRQQYYYMMKGGRVPPTISVGDGPGAAVGVPIPWLEAFVRARAEMVA
jgi:predicted DNA-binding transcriptional regulator AlpA